MFFATKYFLYYFYLSDNEVFDDRDIPKTKELDDPSKSLVASCVWYSLHNPDEKSHFPWTSNLSRTFSSSLLRSHCQIY